MSTYLGGLTVSPGTPVDLGLWTGPGTNSFYPYIFTGSYTDTATISAVVDETIPVVGDKLCYSGAFSGRVCSNTVVTTGNLVCYSVSMCYAGETFTHQDANTEALGNGDSGGPVYASVSGQVYAAGTINGEIGGSSTCTGEPGGNGRSCSPSGIFEPVAYGLGPDTTGWGLLVTSP